jgi:hypothetical protein
MTKKDYLFFGFLAAFAMWTWHLTSDLADANHRLGNTMEDLMELRIYLWDKHHLGPDDPDPLDLFRKDEDNKGRNPDPLGLSPYLEPKKDQKWIRESCKGSRAGSA